MIRRLNMRLAIAQNVENHLCIDILKPQEVCACSAIKCDYIEKKEFKNKREPVKKCPECGGDLYVRYYNKKKILGCSNYPKCHHQEEYHEDKK